MIWLERSYDRFYVREMVTHKDVWPFVHCDGNDRNTYEPPNLEGHIALFVHVDGVWCGGWIFRPIEQGHYEVHTCLFYPITTKDSVKAGKLACNWLKENAGVKYLSSLVPVNNARALWYALKVGFKITGIKELSFMKDGVLLDQTMVGRSLCQ